MRGIAALLGVLAAGALAPAPAPAAGCAPEGTATRYADGAVHVTLERRSARGRRASLALIGCLRATGRRSAVAAPFFEAHEQSAASVLGVAGGRYLWTSEYFTAAESYDTEVQRLTDLKTGRSVTEESGGDDGPKDVLAVPAARRPAAPRS
jgi:hypothetical protein